MTKRRKNKLLKKFKKFISQVFAILPFAILPFAMPIF
jgi:hypothetical protein